VKCGHVGSLPWHMEITLCLNPERREQERCRDAPTLPTSNPILRTHVHPASKWSVCNNVTSQVMPLEKRPLQGLQNFSTNSSLGVGFLNTIFVHVSSGWCRKSASATNSNPTGFPNRDFRKHASVGPHRSDRSVQDHLQPLSQCRKCRAGAGPSQDHPCACR